MHLQSTPVNMKSTGTVKHIELTEFPIKQKAKNSTVFSPQHVSLDLFQYLNFRRQV